METNTLVMLIAFSDIIQRYGIRPTGIFHVGANAGQEVEDYRAQGIENMVLIEADPQVFKKLKANVSHLPYAIPICALCSDVSGKEVDFHRANNDGQASSMLEFGTHERMHPEVKFIGNIALETVRADVVCAQYNIDLVDYDFLNIDVQGTELKVLMGMGEDLRKINYAYIEVNRDELYKGCARVDEIDAYLQAFGMQRKEMKMTNFGWGDAYYSR
jgi:FkbM family methyltransferase